MGAAGKGCCLCRRIRLSVCFGAGTAGIGSRRGIFVGSRGFFQPSQIKILTVLALGILAGLFEPRVLVGAVVDHQVHHDVHVPLFGFREEPVHVLHGPEAGINVIVVGDVVALIGQRGPVDR